MSSTQWTFHTQLRGRGVRLTGAAKGRRRAGAFADASWPTPAFSEITAGDVPSMSRSYSHETSTMSSPSFASTVSRTSPELFLKVSLILRIEGRFSARFSARRPGKA